MLRKARPLIALISSQSFHIENIDHAAAYLPTNDIERLAATYHEMVYLPPAYQ